MNRLLFGDNLDWLRNREIFPDAGVDLVYLDPPFNSNADYNVLFREASGEASQAQFHAFTDTWNWADADATYREFVDACPNTAVVEMIEALHMFLRHSPMMAYLAMMAPRLVELHRVLKPTGSFYLHCDPTASHYLKLIVDGVFCSQGGEFQNEIVWNYSGWNAQLADAFNWRHDVIFFYGKRTKQHFNSYCLHWGSEEEYLRLRKQKLQVDRNGRKYVLSDAGKGQKVKRYLDEAMGYGQPVDDVWPIDKINNSSTERLGYPTQKPKALLERIVKASSNEGDLVLDAYAGCGTTIAVSELFKRQWIGIDITYQSISLVMARLEAEFGKDVKLGITLDGIPKDIESAIALANKKDDRVRKEFEKWAVLTFTENRAIINEKKGADAGIDGTAYTQTSTTDNAKLVLQVKSGGVQRGDIAKLRGDMGREGAEMAVLITLEPPTSPMLKEAKAAGQYQHPLMQKRYDRIQIVTIKEMIEQGKRMDLPLNLEVLKKAQAAPDAQQEGLKL